MNKLLLSIVPIALLLWTLAVGSFSSSSTEYAIVDRRHETYMLDKDGNPITELKPSSENLPYNDMQIKYDALVYLAEDHYEDALKVFFQELKSYPDDPWLLCCIAEIYEVYLKDSARATEYYEKAYAAKPEYPWAVYQKSYRELATGDYMHGIDLLCTLVERMDTLSPDDRKYAFWAADYLVQISFSKLSVEGINSIWDQVVQCDYLHDFDLYVLAVYVSGAKVAIQYGANDPAFTQSLQTYRTLLESSSFDHEELLQALKTQYSTIYFSTCTQLLESHDL